MIGREEIKELGAIARTPFGAPDFLIGAHFEVEPQIAGAIDIPTFLKTQGKLSRADMQLMVEQASVLLEMFYVHMPLKRAMHAIDPLQQLRLLKHRLNRMPEGQKPNEIAFHSQMLKIFASLRDLHTNYLLPSPFNDKTAVLPFLIEEYFEDGSRKYMVSKLAQGFSHPTFVPGIEVLYWNGVPIERAVEINSDKQAGSNAEARHARGLDSLTIRPMRVSLPPDEEWVIIGYRSLNGEELEVRHKWAVITPAPIGGIDTEALTRKAAALGSDIKTQMIQETKKALFAPHIAPTRKRISPEPGGVNPNALTRKATSLGNDIKTQLIQDAKKALFSPRIAIAERMIADGKITRASPANALETNMPGVFKAQTVNTPHGTYGYIRIYTFYIEDPLDDDDFITEFMRLVDLLPKNGLILDVRDNGGGLIFASERLLQLLTPHYIKPEPAQFIDTPLTLELCRRNSSPSGPVDLSAWLESMEQSIETGATFSKGIPITSEEECNNIGQVYFGPVVLITDALCYSATDIFAAGFQDNKVGPILGVHRNTGAGGANVWTHELLRLLMDGGSPLTPLRNRGNMRVSIRRLLRVNENEGMPLEDLGVVPDLKHDITKEDILNDNIDLKNHAASILTQMPVYELMVDVSPGTEGKLNLSVNARNISRLDLFVGDRPQQSLDVISGAAQFTIHPPQQGPLFVELRGYKDGNLVAVRRGEIQ